jgi:hypothetical protein
MSCVLRTAAVAVTIYVCLSVRAAAQSAAPAPNPTRASAGQSSSLEGVATQIRELRVALDGFRLQLADSLRESEELRRQLQQVREQLKSLQSDRLSTVVEDQELLRAKVDDQEQTKVESGSKYHVRLSGLMLLNLEGTRGSVDNLDLPAVAAGPVAGETAGTFGGSVRQSQLGLQMFGPSLGGAKSSGDIAFDFFGGFPATREGVSSPLVRLRTGGFTLDWNTSSVRIGQDAPFFSPRSPTSLVSTAYPSLASAGNLWAWALQLHVDHRIALPDHSTIVVQGGVLDPLTGELPLREYNRMPTAGERSGIPAQAARIGWQRGADEDLAAIGVGAYHSTQNWGFGRNVESWAATTDWELPLGRHVATSGELYRGRAIAGLGGGASDSVLFDGPPSWPSTGVVPVDTLGGWTQLKFKPLSRLELNLALGEDAPFRSRLVRLLPKSVDPFLVSRNASGFVNAIYQARSNILFSVEYRRLWTTTLDDLSRKADHVSVGTGVVF